MLNLKTKTKCQLTKELLQRRIESMQVDDLLPSEPALVKELGVSRFTVSRAVAQLVAEGRVYRIQGKGTFVRNPSAAQSLSNGSTLPRASRRIGLILGKGVGPHQQNGGFYGPIFQGLREAMEKAGYSLVFGDGHCLPEDTDALSRRIDKDRLEGMLIIGRIHENAMDMLLQHSVPHVYIDRNLGGVADSVGTRNTEGAREAVRHLIEQGHRRIAYCIYELHTSFSERLAGFRDGLAEAGIEIRSDWIVTNLRDPEAIQHLLVTDPGSPVRPTAIFCGNDHMASSVMQMVRAAGLRIPEDISVMGFDDDYIAPHLEPALTTMRVPRERMGRLAGEMILARLKTPDAPFREERLPTELVQRASVCPP